MAAMHLPRPAAYSDVEQPHAWEHAEPAGRSFHHETLFYGGEDGFLEGTVPFITGALEAEEPVLVIVGDDKIKLLKQTLGGESAQVQFADMLELGRNPARIIPAWREFLERCGLDGRPVRGVGEPIWHGRSPAELTECQSHESLLNLAFDGGQCWRLLCPYDVDALDEQIIEAAKRSHPFMAQDGTSARSDAYLGPHESAGPFDGALPEPLTEPQEFMFTPADLTTLRATLSRLAADVLLSVERTEHLLLAVSELATNSVRYGGGSGALRMWREGETLICEVRDRGHIDEPLAGRSRPSPDQLSGRGLWLVNQLCDLVQIRSSPGGSVVRIHVRLT
jgi:anti-sigma regulatory factor (Ser/Thr protein kinase)